MPIICPRDWVTFLGHARKVTQKKWLNCYIYEYSAFLAETFRLTTVAPSRCTSLIGTIQ